MTISFSDGWQILQDVHDAGERLGLFQPDFRPTIGNQISEWEELPELKQLQLVYADQPYFGRELRYFNQAPWWYKREFDVPADAGSYAKLAFTNADYYCKVWLNGKFVGEHEGYSMPFAFRVDEKIRRGEKNTLIVKVWSPWDTEIDGGRDDRRTFLVTRNMVKGTYEHSDTFIQRDVNPVGLYGSVALELCGDACLSEAPDVSYTLDDALKNVRLRVKTGVEIIDGKECTIRLTCCDRLTHEKICTEAIPVVTSGTYTLEADARDIRLWNTWDKGGTWLYDIEIELLRDGKVLQKTSETAGFRKIEMVRDAAQTRFYLNGRSFYVRGTSYFPDVYASNMCAERYKRDLLAIRAAGFNLVRLHVHVELPVFYELCSEIGIGIMQDSEYNWMHPITDDFADRFIRVYLDTVKMLKRYSAMFCWICMNEPGLEDPMGRTMGRAMTVNPGPRLLRSVKELDPSRPVIKGSFCEDDPDSGDSHNYIGSLEGSDGHYAEIFGTTEKYNTEFGFDAPPCLFDLVKCPPAYKRLMGITDKIGEIQYYQYKLIKYYIEHYRMQKYAPNAGYVQFMFNDLCPQSFYGIYDWWGLPKAGVDAVFESNMPIGIFLKYNGDYIEGVYAVNDSLEDLGNVQARYVFTDGNGDVIASETMNIDLAPDSIISVCSPDLKRNSCEHLSCALILEKDEKILAVNHYEDLFNMPEHFHGHPERMNHEIGMRLYNA